MPGLHFLASIISILSGTQLFDSGTCGESLGHMHFRLMTRSTYVVKRQIYSGEGPS